MQHLDFWVYNKEQTFEQFQPELEKLFRCRDFLHDVENYWEYLYGYSQKYRCKINVSRPNEQDMRSGEKEVPLHLIFYDCDPAYGDQIGNELNFCFKLPVYQGIVLKVPDTHYEWNFQKTRTFNQIDFSGLIKAAK